MIGKVHSLTTAPKTALSPSLISYKTLEQKRLFSSQYDDFPPTCAAVKQPAPDFKATAVIGEEFKDVKLSDYKGKWLVLFFYPLDFTFVCPTEIVAFSDRIKEFKDLGTEVVGVSVDSKFCHLAWIKTPKKDGGLGGKINYPLVADITKQISSDYGVLLENDGIALRGLFLIDPKGVVRQSTINDLPVGRSVDETLRLIKAFQYNEKHGEVCPSDWQPGKPTMKDNPNGAKQFWQKHF
jgi:alkyl hydroperoxide reductase subunit AhpC